MSIFDSFERKHDYLVCVDSDGCVMDTMNALVDALLTGPEAFKGADPIDSYCGMWDTHM